MKALVALAAAVLVSGCSGLFFDNLGSLYVSDEAKKALRAPTLPFKTVVRSGTGVVQDGGFSAIIRSQADLDAFFSSHQELSALAYELASKPPLDFSQEQGLIIVDRPHTSGGDGIEITAIEEQAERLLVHSIRWHTPPGQRRPLMVTQPHHYVSMPRSDKPIEFAWPVDAYMGARKW